MRALSRLRDGLVGAWCPSVSGWGGNVLKDLSGQGNHGTLTNMDPATDWVVSDGKQALDFDGSDYVLTTLTPPATSTLSASLWFNITGSGTARLLSINNAQFAFTTDNLFRASALDIYNADSSVGFAANKWFHGVAVLASSTISLYINGTLLASTATNGAPISTGPLYFGDRAGGGRPLTGQLDDIRVYNRVLSPDEIRLLASERGIGLKPERKRRPPRVQVAPTPPPVSNKIGTTKRRNKDRLRDGLVGAWCPSVSGWGGNLIKDLSGQGNHGTLIGLNPAEDWVIRTLPAINFPDFDATQYIGIPILARSIAPPFSISAWFRVASQFGSNLTIGNSASLAGYRIFMNNTWRAQSHDGVSQSLAEGSSVVLNAWVNVVAVFSANARRSITIAGFSTAVDTGSIAVGSCDYVRLGARGGSTPDFYAGQLDDARIYNRVLTEQEIRLLASERGIGLRPERTRRLVQGQAFTAARLRRQSLIGSGVY